MMLLESPLMILSSQPAFSRRAAPLWLPAPVLLRHARS
jgi:hypothetical protein